METFVSIERALTLLSENALDLATEQIELKDAGGRTLAQDLFAKVDDPTFDNAAMDGWAVNSGAKERTEVGIAAAGDAPTKIEPGQAVRIMTGAPMPEGADAIVMVEDGLDGQARIEFVRRRAENFAAGDRLLSEGERLTPAAVSLAATGGHPSLSVYAHPRVAVLSTGDELIPPGENLGPGQIYESNSHGLCALLEQIDCIPVLHPVVEDSMDGLRDALDGLAPEVDAILTSGGVSMGEFDFVRRLMEEEGECIFWKVKMRPGGPPLFGRWKGTPLLGLPGNPVSSHVVFTMLAAPWLATREHLARKVRVHLKDPVRGAPGKVCLRRIQIQVEGDRLVASTHTHQGSGNIHSMVAHNGLTLLPPDGDAAEGDVIDALWLI